MDRGARGRAAERLARDFLAGHGLVPLAANWRRRVGEIDLVMREPDGTIVFVEVRYRAGAGLEEALESVDAPKRARLRRAALAWLQRHADEDAPARVDVVAIDDAGGEAAAERDGHAEGDGTRPERIRGVVPADGRRHRVEWVVGAVEDDG